MQATAPITEKFNTDGYVVVRGLLSWEDDLQPVLIEFDRVLDRLIARWQAEGRVMSTFFELPFDRKLISAVAEARAPYDQEFEISLPQSGLTDQTPMHHGQAVFDLLRSPRLLDVVERFIGPEIYCNPVQHTRIKLPEAMLPRALRNALTAEIALHQDQGVVTADATETLTVWIPMTVCNERNGCLAVVPGSHRQGLTLHCRSRDAQTLGQICIPDALRPANQAPMPMEPGDVLFMHRRMQHAGLPNRSETIRWSFDLRYQPIGQPTGRRWFPGFVARSRARPQTEVHEVAAWAKLWHEARRDQASVQNATFNRWKDDDPRCA